jgi:hypothetical protein
MTNVVHRQPAICPACGELIIAAACENTFTVPEHPDMILTASICPASRRIVTAAPILR